MRENNRNSIEKCRKKLPQFTTMNVIDGQAGLISYFSLIFYSLTIDNILNIIVLLILAGVSIATLTGENGILTRAQEAKNKTEEATLEEKIQLLASETVINQYTGENEEKTAQELQKELNDQGENVLVIQWDKYIIFDLNENKEYRVKNDGTTEYWGESTMGQTLLNTKTANADQLEQDSSSSNLIGIDNEGNTVNMLLWEKTLIDDSNLGKVGTYGLNDKNGLDGTGISGRSAGYVGNYTEAGEIIGTVPAYISEDGGNTYISVTSMAHTFYDCDSLIIAPEIANTVTDMFVCFYQASNLTTAPNKIPNSVTSIGYAFSNCEKLNTVPTLGKNINNMICAFRGTSIKKFDTIIPTGVTIMTSTFAECSQLEEFNSIIPGTVVNLSEAFKNCTALKIFNSSIPDGVTRMGGTFQNCKVLQTAPSYIPSTVTNMFQTFSGCNNLTGTIQINANLSGATVMNYNGRDYKDYEQCFSSVSTAGEGLIISKNSTCPELENLIKTKSSNSNIKLEECTKR